MSIEQAVQAWGLPGLVLGAALEGETVAFLAGVLAHRRFFPFEAAALAVTLGALIVDNAMFWLGRRAGGRGRVARMLARPRVAALAARVRVRPEAWVLGFRWVWGMKTAGAALIGASGLGWGRFVLLDGLAALIWAHLVVGAGFLGGAALEAAFGRLALHWHLGVVLAGFAAGALLLWLWARRRG